MYSWRDEPESCSYDEKTVDGEACPECGEDAGEQSVYGNSRLYSGTAECHECGHRWDIDYEDDGERDYFFNDRWN